MINTAIAQKKYIPGQSNYQGAKKTGRYPSAPTFGKAGIMKISVHCLSHILPLPAVP